MKHLFQNTDSDRNLKVRNNPDGMCFSSAGGFKITVSLLIDLGTVDFLQTNRR